MGRKNMMSKMTMKCILVFISISLLLFGNLILFGDITIYENDPVKRVEIAKNMMTSGYVLLLLCIMYEYYKK